MLFLDSWFWGFAAVALPGFWLLPGPLKLYWLVGASAVFHWYFAGPAGMAPIVVLGICTYAAGLALVPDRRPRLFPWVAALVIGVLAFYKYSDFAIGTLGTAFDLDALRLSNWSAPAAPLAISFFTFEFVHYLYEVRKRGRAPVRNPVHFALFAIFFPSLASGPIKRFNDFVPQLEQLSNPTVSVAWEGARRVIHGLFKKICIADLLVEYIVVFENPAVYTAELVVTLAVLQGFRIYYDFAGYSDIAIGLARMLNLRIPENFDRPYLTTSLQDFWRRWHMSLSTWIRDYVYIPLGGNRAHQVANLVAAMALCGLWHGAAWNFVVWGAYHGAGLALENGVRRLWPAGFGAHPVLRVARWAVCYTFVSFGWLLFFYPIEEVFRMIREVASW